jgi:hypothetical protein
MPIRYYCVVAVNDAVKLAHSPYTASCGMAFFPLIYRAILSHKISIKFLVAPSAHSRSNGRVPHPERAALVSAA